MYVKLTDGAVTRFYNLADPKQRSIYNELIDHNTGFNVVVGNDGKVKEFSEAQVQEVIETTRAAANKKRLKETVNPYRQVKDDE